VLFVKKSTLDDEKNIHYEAIKEFFRRDNPKRAGLYDKDAKELKKELQKRKMWRAYISSLNEILDDIPEIKSVIDVGCGMGNFTFELVNCGRFDRIVGLDFLKETFSIACKNPEIFRNVDFIQGNLLDIPFKNRCFDAAFCLNTLHHIHPEDLKKAIKELTRITDKYLVIEIRNKKNVFDFYHSRIVLPTLYKDLPVYSNVVSEINSLAKKYNFQLETIAGKSTLNWMNGRLVIVYKRIDGI